MLGTRPEHNHVFFSYTPHLIFELGVCPMHFMPLYEPYALPFLFSFLHLYP
jgi:hypothetical protein